MHPSRLALTSLIITHVLVAQLKGREQRSCPVPPTDGIPLYKSPSAADFRAYHAFEVAALAIKSLMTTPGNVQ